MRYATGSTGAWTLGTIDGDGEVGQYPSLFLDSDDHAHISYCEYDYMDLRYATNQSGTWEIETVDSSASVIYGSSIATDSHGNPHVCYIDSDQKRLKYAERIKGKFSLVIEKEGDGFGTVTESSSALDCGYDCVGLFDTGSTVTVTAEANEGSTFFGWTGGSCSGTDPCTFDMDSNLVVTAIFQVGSRCGLPKSTSNRIAKTLCPLRQ